MTEQNTAFERECFFITPIGEEGSEERQRADGVLEAIVKPASKELDLMAVRADHIAQPGQITRQIIDHVVYAKAAVADVTGKNANVFYEMGVRDSFKRPLVLIAEEGTTNPFDYLQMRTIYYRLGDFQSAARCRDNISEHLKKALDGLVDSPVSAALDLANLQSGRPVDRAIAELVGQVDVPAQNQRETRLAIEALMERDHTDERTRFEQNELIDALMARFTRTMGEKSQLERHALAIAHKSNPDDVIELANILDMTKHGLNDTRHAIEILRRADHRTTRPNPRMPGRASEPRNKLESSLLTSAIPLETTIEADHEDRAEKVTTRSIRCRISPARCRSTHQHGRCKW